MWPRQEIQARAKRYRFDWKWLYPEPGTLNAAKSNDASVFFETCRLAERKNLLLEKFWMLSRGEAQSTLFDMKDSLILPLLQPLPNNWYIVIFSAGLFTHRSNHHFNISDLNIELLMCTPNCTVVVFPPSSLYTIKVIKNVGMEMLWNVVKQIFLKPDF